MAVRLPTYPVTPVPAWTAPYIGIPHEMGARGPEFYDCWGIIVLALRQELGIELPGREGFYWERDDVESRRECQRLVDEERAAWWDPVEPGQERRFDVIVLSIAGRPLHVGLVADPGWVLHSTEGADCACERYDGPVWKHRVDGFYRFRGER